MAPLIALLPAAAEAGGTAAAAGGAAAAGAAAASTAAEAAAMAASVGDVASAASTAAEAAAMAASVGGVASAASSGITLSQIMTAASLLGSGISAVGGISQAQTQAGILQQNANVARIQGSMTAQTEKAKQLSLSEQRRRMIGEQIAKYGGAGIDPGVGTPLDVMADTYKQYERDIQYSGYTGAVAETVGGYEAASDTWAAGMAQTSGYLNAGATLLGGVSKPFLTGAGSSLQVNP